MPKRLITNRYNFEEAEQAFELVKAARQELFKVVISGLQCNDGAGSWINFCSLGLTQYLQMVPHPIPQYPVPDLLDLLKDCSRFRFRFQALRKASLTRVCAILSTVWQIIGTPYTERGARNAGPQCRDRSPSYPSYRRIQVLVAG